MKNAHLERVNFIVYRVFVNIIGIGLAAILFRHVEISSFPTLVGAALVLTALNLVLKPILYMIALPLVILTFGFFFLVVNAVVLMLASAFFAGFTIEGLWAAIGGAIVIGVVNLLFDAFSARAEYRYFDWK